MKKIAIQLFGHLRTFEYTFPSFYEKVIIPNIEDGYDIDIFIHSWDEYEHSTVNYRNPDGIPSEKKLIDKEIVEKLYKPKSMFIESQEDITEEIFLEKIASVKRSIKGCLNNSKTIFSVNKLRLDYEKQNNMKYDWVIQTRPDILFHSIFRIEDYLYTYKKFDMSIPEDALFYAHNPFNRGDIQDPYLICGSDLIYFASSDVMNKATSLYINFFDNIDTSNFFSFEYWWMSFWKSKNIKPIPIKFLFGIDADVLYLKDLSNFLKKQEKKCEVSMISKKKIYLFNIHLLTIKRSNKEIKYYFCEIPFFKIKNKNFKTKYYLFGINLLSIKEK